MNKIEEFNVLHTNAFGQRGIPRNDPPANDLQGYYKDDTMGSLY